MGALLYELLSGQPPWYTKDRNKLFERIKTAPLKMPKGLKPKLSKDGEALLRARDATAEVLEGYSLADAATGDGGEVFQA